MVTLRYEKMKIITESRTAKVPGYSKSYMTGLAKRPLSKASETTSKTPSLKIKTSTPLPKVCRRPRASMYGPCWKTWLKSEHIPEVKALVQGGQLVIEQMGKDVFQFPLEVALRTNRGVHTQRYTIKERSINFLSRTPKQSRMFRSTPTTRCC